ncbi:MAG: N-acetylmuramoyl-L-alanine amidase, partial [Anaerolineae bacterium]
MNKLGFYIENSTVPFIREALALIKPPVILFHAGDRGLLREIRTSLSPDSFIIGRLFVTLDEQVRWLDANDPEGAGAAYADRILEYDFGYATERVNGRLLINAWMGPNETLPGPASFRNYQLGTPLDRYPEFAEFYQRRSQALDRFQAAFRMRLQTAAIEAVAFNFGAGNYTDASHYLDWFPRTLETYRYLGFHEYGWPALMPRADTSSAALLYRGAMRGICQRYNNRHTAIITEAGLARMYKIGDGGDVGWLYSPDSVTQDSYWESLDWYNDQLCRDTYALGACLFQVGHAGRWETFRHLGVDNQQRPITLSNRIATLKDRQAPPLNPDCTTPVEYPADEWRQAPGPVTRPAWTDVHALLLRSPTVRYAVRPWNTIRRLIIHHTVTSGDITPDLIARAQVQQGKPGITYHFLIQANGAIYQTNTLRTTATHCGADPVNADSIGVALAGDFSAAPPPARQLTSAAKLCAFLLQEFDLTTDNINGRSEVDPGVASPGASWLQGAAWKNTLFSEVHSQFPPIGLTCDELLAQALTDLTQARSDLTAALERAQRAEAQAAQVSSLTAEVTRLQADNQNLRMQLTDGELALTQYQVQVEGLQDLTGNLRRQVAEQQTAIIALQAQITDLQQRLTDCLAGQLPPDGGEPPGGGEPPDGGEPPGGGEPP